MKKMMKSILFILFLFPLSLSASNDTITNRDTLNISDTINMIKHTNPNYSMKSDSITVKLIYVSNSPLIVGNDNDYWERYGSIWGATLTFIGTLFLVGITLFIGLKNIKNSLIINQENIAHQKNLKDKEILFDKKNLLIDEAINKYSKLIEQYFSIRSYLFSGHGIEENHLKNLIQELLINTSILELILSNNIFSNIKEPIILANENLINHIQSMKNLSYTTSSLEAKKISELLTVLNDSFKTLVNIR